MRWALGIGKLACFGVVGYMAYLCALSGLAWLALPAVCVAMSLFAEGMLILVEWRDEG